MDPRIVDYEGVFQCYSIERVLETTGHSKWDCFPDRDFISGHGWRWEIRGENLLKFIGLNSFTTNQSLIGSGLKLRNQKG
jgi:hypothetical protein